MANIGVFDSGVGGLTVLKELAFRKKANYFYFGDCLRAPYGSRPKEEIRDFAFQIVDFLETFDIDEYVIACNTISVLATDDLISHYHKDFYPIARAGVDLALDNDGDYLQLATQATINSHYYRDEILRYKDCEVYEVAAIELVPMIENGILQGPELDKYLSQYLKIANEKKPENILLACTHYPIIIDAIRKNLTYEANILNPANKVAERLNRQETDDSNINVFMSEVTPNTKKILDDFIGHEYKLEVKELK